MTSYAHDPYGGNWKIMQERNAVVKESRTWLKTPFHHGQRVKGVGVDCANFVIGVFTNTSLVDQYEPRYYAADWFLHEDSDLVRDALQRDFVPVAQTAVQHGDVAIFRYGRAVSHIGIVQLWPLIIHADRLTGSVIEESADPHSTLGARLAGTWTMKRWNLHG